VPQLRSWLGRVLRGGEDLWTRHADLLPGRLRTVVVVADDDPQAPVAAYLDPPGAERVVVLAPREHPEWELAAHGAELRTAVDLAEANARLRFRSDVDALVDVGRRSPEEQDDWWWRLYLHLQPGGLYAVDRSRSLGDGLSPRLASYAGTAGLGRQELEELGVEDRPRRRAVDRVVVDDHHVLLHRAGPIVLKVRDRHADEVLPEREPDLHVEVLRTLPAQTFTSRAHVVSHESSVPIDLPGPELPVPALSLRHYRGDVASAGNALLVSGTSALPDSFRHHANLNPRNPRLVEVSPEFGRRRPRDEPVRTLEGTYFHLDSENPGHFGHLLTEVISRLWGWDEAKALHPDLKALFHVRGPEQDTALERRVLGAFGIAEDDVTWTHEPVRLESVVAATPMFHNAEPHYVHPDLARVWARLRDALVAEDPAPTAGFERSGGRRLFVSRRDVTGNRSCRNTREVEAFFAERGFDVLYPEDHELAVQAAVFDRAEVVAGFGGSAMFNVLFSHGPRATILLNHEAYTARNEHLFAAVLGGELHYFWSTPDLPHPEGRWSQEAYYSPWEFDFDRNAGPLDDLLRGL
jgi:capsular polysaccharide biosynthesis protein